jgi:hypothetical protein
MKSLWQSRKFWIMIVDVLISTVTYFVGQYVSPEVGKNILWLIGSWQPVIYAVITGIATEDAASVAAMSAENVASISVGTSTTPPAAG